MLKLGQIIDGETRDMVNKEIAELKDSVQAWIRIAGESQKSANLCAAEIAKKDEEIILLSTERDEALKLKRWADNDVLEIRRLLDLLGAPTKQPSGYPYSIVGMLSALTAQIVGESWAATIRELHARISQQRVEIARLKQLGEKSGEEIRHLRACIVDQADWGLCKEEWMAKIARLNNRDGNAHIQLLLPTKDDPFNRVDLKIVDFGVADNIYVTESEEIARLNALLEEEEKSKAALLRANEAVVNTLRLNCEEVDRLNTLLEEAKKRFDYNHWRSIPIF